MTPVSLPHNAYPAVVPLEETRIRPEDTVLHRPTGETWVVRDVQGEYLSWYGYPPGRARVADCEKVRDDTFVTLRSLLISARAGVVVYEGASYALTWWE